jgi:hypothetical protein
MVLIPPQLLSTGRLENLCLGDIPKRVKQELERGTGAIILQSRL